MTTWAVNDNFFTTIPAADVDALRLSSLKKSGYAGWAAATKSDAEGPDLIGVGSGEK